MPGVNGTYRETLDFTPEPIAKWMDEANCTDIPLEIFFLNSKGESYAEAKRICNECAVQNECLLLAFKYEGFARTPHGRFGIYGGLSPLERAGLNSSERNKLRAELENDPGFKKRGRNRAR